MTLEIKDDGRPLHRDATARIRPRVFLEGGFLVELRPGSPSAPELRRRRHDPARADAIPVQFHQVLTVFDAPARESLRGTRRRARRAGSSDGGAEGLKTLAPELEPLLRDLAWRRRGGARHRAARPVAS